MLEDWEKDYREGYREELTKIVNIFIDNYLQEFDYKSYRIDEENYVINIMDSFIVYFGIYKGEDDYSSTIIMEELTYNELFDFRISKFREYLRRNNTVGVMYKIYDGIFEKNVRFNNIFSYIYIDSKFEYVNSKIPELHLKERYDSWDGILYNFIVYELEYNGITGYAVTSTTNKLPLKYAYNVEKTLEEHALFGARCPAGDQFCRQNKLVAFGSFMYTKEFTHQAHLMEDDIIRGKYNPKSFVGGRAPIFESHLKYFTFPVYLKKPIDEFYMQREILVDCKNGKYSDVDKIDFAVGDYKWKSEELMYKCIKKIFKDSNVVQQYRPYFLSTAKGQMSYDVYVVDKKIAFEYQGKQHYEPVEFFGGQKNFEEQQKRDRLKEEISKKKRIKLIYVRYDEDISVELIKQKLGLGSN